MTTMPIDNHPLTPKRLQFIDINVTELTLKSINIIQSSTTALSAGTQTILSKFMINVMTLILKLSISHFGNFAFLFNCTPVGRMYHDLAPVYNNLFEQQPHRLR